MNAKDYIWIEIGLFTIFSIWLIIFCKKKPAGLNVIISEKFSASIIVIILWISVLGYILNDHEFSLKCEFVIIILWSFVNYVRIKKGINIESFFNKGLNKFYDVLGLIALLFLILTYLFQSIQCLIVFELAGISGFVVYFFSIDS